MTGAKAEVLNILAEHLLLCVRIPLTSAAMVLSAKR